MTFLREKEKFLCKGFYLSSSPSRHVAPNPAVLQICIFTIDFALCHSKPFPAFLCLREYTAGVAAQQTSLWNRPTTHHPAFLTITWQPENSPFSVLCFEKLIFSHLFKLLSPRQAERGERDFEPWLRVALPHSFSFQEWLLHKGGCVQRKATFWTPVYTTGGFYYSYRKNGGCCCAQVLLAYIQPTHI